MRAGSVDQSIFTVAMEVEMSGKSVQQFMNKKGPGGPQASSSFILDLQAHRRSIETKFRTLLEEDGWDLMNFVYVDTCARLTMEWRPKPKQ